MNSLEGIDTKALLAAIASMISAWGLKVLGAVALLIAGWVAARIIRRSARRALERSRLDATLIPFFSSLVYYIVLAILVIAALSLFGIETTSFVALFGALGLAVGLALQGTLSNFSSGVMLLVFRPFKVGDYVDAGGAAGTVVEIGIFATALNTPDNVRIIVPNSGIYGQTIRNYSQNDTRRIDMLVGISYDDEIQSAVDTINKVLAADDRVLEDPAPVVAVSEMADSSVNLVVRPWCNRPDYWSLRFDLTRRMKEELEASGCSIPYPQRDVHLHQVSGKAGASAASAA